MHMHTNKYIHPGIYKIFSISKLWNMSSNSSEELMEDPPLYQHRVTESVQTSGSRDYTALVGRAGLLQ